jgi:uncharacterized membrane protein
MKGRRFTFGIAVFGTMLLGASTAAAGFRVCNRSAESVDVAIGYNDAERGWTSRGWWVLQSGACATIITGPLKSRYYYLYGHGGRGTRWQAAPAQVGGGFCITPKRFTLYVDDFRIDEKTIKCDGDGMQFRKFRVIDTHPYRDYTYNLLDRAGPQGPVAGAPQPPATGGPQGPGGGAPVTNPPSQQPTSGRPAGTACQRYPNLC